MELVERRPPDTPDDLLVDAAHHIPLFVGHPARLFRHRFDLGPFVHRNPVERLAGLPFRFLEPVRGGHHDQAVILEILEPARSPAQVIFAVRFIVRIHVAQLRREQWRFPFVEQPEIRPKNRLPGAERLVISAQVLAFDETATQRKEHK